MKRIFRSLILIILSQLAPLSASALTLSWPVDCELGKNCWVQSHADAQKGPSPLDFRCGYETYANHKGMDIRLRSLANMESGIKVFAAADGKVINIRDGVADLYFEPGRKSYIEAIALGNGVVVEHENGWRTVYGHLRRGSVQVQKGQSVIRGDLLGEIGLSGKTQFPHLHFQLSRHIDNRVVHIDSMTGQPVGTKCGLKAQSHWADTVTKKLLLDTGPVILDLGMSSVIPVDYLDIEAGQLYIFPLKESSENLIFFIRTIRLPADAITNLIVEIPGKKISKSFPAKGSYKAQQWFYISIKRPVSGWLAGNYKIMGEIIKNNKTIKSKEYVVSWKP